MIKGPVNNSPETLAALHERLGDLGMIPNHILHRNKVGLCMMGWVLVIDDRNPTRKVSVYPPETTAAVLN